MNRKKLTAAELMASLSKNEGYQLANKEREKQRNQKQVELVEEFKKFSMDCTSLGYSVETAWDLVGTEKPYPELIPVLIRYMKESNHTTKFKEGIARALATRESAKYYKDILDQFKSVENSEGEVRWALACALAQSAQEQIEVNEIAEILRDSTYGRDRAPLVQVINRMTGEQRKDIIDIVGKDKDLKGDLQLHKIR